MDWIQHTKTRQVSVIAIADHRTNQPRRDRFIRHTREVFRREEVECEIWIVDPQGYNVTPLTGARKIRSARKIATAIRNASFDSIAVIDCDYPLEASHWESVSSRLRENNIVTFSHPRPIVAGYKKYLFAIYVFMMRFLLGVGKTCLNPGMVVFQKSAIRDGDLNSIADHHVDAIGQLICLSRLDHKPIIETDTTAARFLPFHYFNHNHN